MNHIVLYNSRDVKHESQTHGIMNHMSAHELATYLKDKLERKGWSQRTLAMYSGVSQPTIVRALKGNKLPEPENLRKIADALEIDQVYLFRKAGYITSVGDEFLDPAARYVAQRITQLPPDIREQALDTVGAQLDAVFNLSGITESDKAVSKVTEGYEVLTPAQDFARVMRMIERKDPEFYQELLDLIDEVNNSDDVDTSGAVGQEP